MNLQVINISVNDLETMLLNVLEPIKKELEETKAMTSLLTEKYLTTEELAKLLNVAEQTIRARANAGKIPFYMLGSKMRFKMSEINKIITKIK